MQEKHVLDLIRLAHAAALDSRQWPWFLERLSAVAGDIKVQIFCRASGTLDALGFLHHGYDPAFVELYESKFAAQNPWTKRLAKHPAGEPVSGRALLSDAELEKQAFYKEWVLPQGDILGGGALIVENDARHFSVIGGNIPRKDRDRLEPRFLELLRLLAPHMQQAFKTARLLGGLNLNNRILREGLDPELTAVFALDSQRRLCHFDARAATMLAAGDVIGQCPTRQINLCHPEANAMLSRTLHALQFSDVSLTAPFSVRGPGQRQYLCRVLPVHLGDGPLPWILPIKDMPGKTLLLLLTPTNPVRAAVAKENHHS